MADVWTPLQLAIWTKITEDATFASLTDRPRTGMSGMTGPQYYVSQVPDWASYPYADTPGDAVEFPFYEFSGGRGGELVWPIHIWCDIDGGGPAKCRQVGSAIDSALNQANLEVDGWSTMMIQRIHSTQPMREENKPHLFHQVLRYQIMLYKL